MLSYAGTMKLVKRYGIPVPAQALVNTEKELEKAAGSIGYPLVVKAVSSQVSHKTEAKAVITNITGIENAKAAFMEVQDNIRKASPNARIEGVLVQRQIEGHETIIGGKEDSQFGPVIMFGGFGGVFVELFRDTSFRLCPVTKREALDMISETRGAKVMEGFRNIPKRDVGALADALVKVSEMIAAEKVKELDINPLFVSKKGVYAADVRIVL
jgi:acyl-CoA synthetase (NDP forming)